MSVCIAPLLPIAWFEARRIPMADNIAESKISADEIDRYRRDYCSKSFAGIGSNTYNNRIKAETTEQDYKLDTGRLPVDDATNAIAKISIKAGERIELAPALVLSKDQLKSTSLAPFGLYWQDLTEEHHIALRELREAGRLKVQHQGHDTEWHRRDHFTIFEDVVVFPAAGSVGMIERIGGGSKDDTNCEMKIRSSGPESEGAGLVLEVLATKDIQAGDTLRLDIAPTGSDEEKLALIAILESTGQPLSDALQAVKAKNFNNEL